MKYIFNNKYIKVFKFLSSTEMLLFIDNQNCENKLPLDNTYGDNYYSYILYHSLTGEKEFILSFSSDEKEENLNFLFWYEYNLFVLDTGSFIYLIDDTLHIKAYLEVTTPLIGIYLTTKNNLILLEEASFRIVSFEGEILKHELFDLIEDFSLENDQIYIKTSEGNKIFTLM
ncbi:hypothetical protein QNI16_27165 [Cytophagaceae bacterium YF14B1]|uniref:Uncharacterized protein n=1 Tax=Xanthocytophaga flava TaxID=3048013 RepID=A0AAE3QWS1_9BACT|nr:hypothetical protein [Xanthocytophaga flavus]MDJ1484209.1 hypothetical protein [Xanthocytophaga flavus]